jgi:hypothetical protein
MDYILDPETICDQVRNILKEGIIIPKPRSKEAYRSLGWKSSRGEEAFIYALPKRPKSKRASTKRIPSSVFKEACRILIEDGAITKAWFTEAFPKLNADGSCNFTTLGGVFQILGFAKWAKPGSYKRL